ncbi:MAG TPA: glycoside hydrolase family 97 protein [Panacibacter sp.]|nr:glycoside hydrolase family 97 protein [Panacibacter sp.]HNP43843.1 glycoside hydrolase family 97 protein [Panacibacter sp.]
MCAYIKLISVFTFAIMLTSVGLSQSNYMASSPDKNIRLVVSRNDAGEIKYSLSYKNKDVIKPSSVGFILSKPEVKLTNFSIAAVDTSSFDETWKPVWGEVSIIRNNYEELTLHLKDRSGSGMVLNLIFRVFNDGIGFRYEFPKQDAVNYFIVADELTQFALSGDNKTFWIPGDYDSNEYPYNTTKLSEVDALTAANKEKDIAVKSLIGANAVQTPLMMKSTEGLYINIHEAALLNYPAMDLLLNKQTLTLTSTLVPDAVGNKAYMHAPCKTPWRTIVVSDKAADILASKLILNLNDPANIGDVSWIKPEKFIGVWWEMHIGKGTWDMASGKHAANTANVKKYIDFAAKYGFNGVLVEGWNDGWEDWFGNWKENVFDFVTPYADYNIDELTAYAKSKGVKIIMHHETSGAVTNYERWMDTAYRFMINHNMDAVKTGYVGKIIPRGEHHDGQWMVSHYQRVAEKTAFYHIMLDAHEPVHPTGLQRTYPNWLASEAARGTEFNNAPALGILPEHTTILPFTRLMGGPMDFTPGIFHMQLNQFIPQRTTRVRTTVAKQLALYITMYSPLQMAADLPENYEKYLDAFQFIVDVPVDWDDTKILEAEPGDFITIARKEKGKDNWFLGAITDESSRTMSTTLSFLDDGAQYEATIYKDAPNADWDTNPEAYVIEKKLVNSKTKLDISLAKGGGCAISIIKK